jgi:hypothetical protein
MIMALESIIACATAPPKLAVKELRVVHSRDMTFQIGQTRKLCAFFVGVTTWVDTRKGVGRPITDDQQCAQGRFVGISLWFLGFRTTSMRLSVSPIGDAFLLDVCIARLDDLAPRRARMAVAQVHLVELEI